MVAVMCLNPGIEVHHRNLDGCQTDNMFGLRAIVEGVKRMSTCVILI